MPNENKFDQEVLPLSMTTIVRLLDLESSDGLTFYTFLATHAKIQDTNKVWANQKFCKKGLHWGAERVEAAKKLLEAEGFIEVISAERDEGNGTFGKSYIKLEYIPNPKYRYPDRYPDRYPRYPDRYPDTVTPEPGTGFQDTNAYNKKENAYNKKEMPSLFPSGNKSSGEPEEKSFLSEELLDSYQQGIELNRFWKSTGLRGGHDSLESKFLVRGKYGGTSRKTQPVWAPITASIRNVGLDAMKLAVKNYVKYCEQADEYTPQVGFSLAEFCHNTNYLDFLEGKTEHTKKFISNDPWAEIREQFQPLTSVYTEIFNEKEQRYYGFKLDKINSNIRFEDTKHSITLENDAWTFDNFMELEWMIAGFIWRRKHKNELELCKKYMSKWKDLIPRFKKDAKRWLKEDWELYK